MATKKKIEAEVSSPAGVTGPATVGTANPMAPEEAATFDFAVNVVKLNRARAYVRAAQPELKGKDLQEAVKNRYVAIGGLLNEQKLAGRAGKKGGRVVNVADDDGSQD